MHNRKILMCCTYQYEANINAFAAWKVINCCFQQPIRTRKESYRSLHYYIQQTL